VGGPLLDLDGKCIGMNIARVNRSETFAIPAAELQLLIGEFLQNEGGS
jgi:S1-C subfamily serine protease